MTSHEIARALLAGPDCKTLVSVDTDGGPDSFLRAVTGVHVDKPDAMNSESAVVIDTAAHDDPANFD